MPAARKRLPWAAVLLVAVVGCGGGSGPKVVKVTGTLTHKGEPVRNLFIHFEPEYGRLSWAQTDAEGKFKVNYDAHQDGAVVGKHKVWLEYRPTSAADQEAEMTGRPLPVSRDMKALLDKYSAENSKLTVQIAKGMKELKLDLD